jgi:hypothetical protein
VIWIFCVVLFRKLGLNEDVEVRRQIAVTEEWNFAYKTTQNGHLKKKCIQKDIIEMKMKEIASEDMN